MTIDVASVQLVDTATLHAELRRFYSMTVEAVELGAVIYEELQTRGESCPYLSVRFELALRLVLSGRLSAAAAAAFSNHPGHVRLIATLPRRTQDRLAKGGQIPVAAVVGGEIKQKQVRGNGLKLNELKLLVSEGRLLSFSEQAARLRSAKRHDEASEPLRSVRALITASALLALQKRADAEQVKVADLLIRGIGLVLQEGAPERSQVEGSQVTRRDGPLRSVTGVTGNASRVSA